MSDDRVLRCIELCSSPASEHFELDGAISRRRRTNLGRSDNGDVVNIDELHFKTMLDQLRGAVLAGYGDSTQPPTIYKVPEELTVTNLCCDPRVQHEPVAVFLGRAVQEYHLPPDTQRLEKYKWCCARQLISRHSHLLEPARTPVLLNECFTTMKRLLPRIYASYSEEFSKTLRVLPDNEVAEAMLKDGCFILHRLLKYARRVKMERCAGGSNQFDEDEDWTQVYGRCFVWQFVTRDMLLLQNQMPFFVIRELFQQLRNEDEPEELLVTGGLRLFRSLSPQRLHLSPIECDDVHHLLHLFYLSVGRPRTDCQQQHRRRSDELMSELPQWIPCAKELQEAGVRFRKRKNPTSFLDVKFSHGVLEIPQLELDDFSESLFRNLITFEQTYPDTTRDVSTYAVFMNCLVTSAEDMRILDLQGILVNHLNSRRWDPWRFFSDIVAQVHWSADNYLVGLMSAVNRYRNRRRHRWHAALARNYFGNPWVTMSVFAALLLLVMSVLQTFFTVYAYFKPPNQK
uniref:Uncharacterized protein n=3 Tax=Avena sativa TaxID=4498 RepID=A0ACD6ABA3_AVESA